MNLHPAPMLRRATRFLVTFVVALAAGMGWAGSALAQDDLPGRVGRVADVGGELFLAPQDRPDQWTAIGVNYPVTTGDNLWAGNDARAEVDFGAGQFRMAGDTNLHVSRLDDRQFALFVAQGRVSLRVRYLEPGDAARIDTPNAQVVLTRPGLYRVDVSDDREHTRVVVREGEANVQTAGTLQQVLPGQTALVDGMDPRYATVNNGIGTDGFDAWAANRDRRYDRGRSAGYVSPQMVGAAELDQYGTWSEVPEYGNVWYPTGMAADWAPYRNGYWTEVGGWGPTWVDAAPWGYAPFHYGRWVFVGSRWGWCPGTWVARPLWAPAMVGWAGGPGWGLSMTVGAPVFGWVPLAWGEPFRPWWGRCSSGCWDRFNRPYAVNVAVVRPTSPPPTHFVNWNAPGGISAVRGSELVVRRPVQENLVTVPRGIAASAPVMAGVPLVRTEVGRIPTRRVGDGAPPPASTFYPTASRPGGISGATGNAPMNTGVPAGRTTRGDTMPGTPVERQGSVQGTPASRGGIGGMTGAVPSGTRTVQPAPGPQGMTGAAVPVPPTQRQMQGSMPATGASGVGGMQGAVPQTRTEQRASAYPGQSAPASTPPTGAPAQRTAPPPASASRDVYRAPSAAVTTPSPMSQPASPMTRTQPPQVQPSQPQAQPPMMRTQPAQAPAPQAQPLTRSLPAAPAPQAQAAPMARPQPAAPAPPPPSAQPSKPAQDGGNAQRQSRDAAGNNPDKAPR